MDKNVFFGSFQNASEDNDSALNKNKDYKLSDHYINTIMERSSGLLHFYSRSLQNDLIRKLRSYLQRSLALIIIFSLYCIAGSGIAFAQWSPNNPIPVGGGQHPGITGDGAGGAIVAWYTGGSVEAVKLNSAGTSQWGTTIGSGFGQQVPVSIVSDGAGGAIISLISNSNGSIIAQRVNSSGVLQWPGGVTICTGTNTSFDPSIISDGTGGAVITWFDNRNSNSIYSQHINSAGNAEWATNGVAICSGTSPVSVNSYGPETISDGAGGAIVSWTDSRNGNSDVYAQRINASGNIQWTANGIAVNALPGGQSGVKLISDNQGGAIAAWIDNRNGNNDIYAQRINSSGLTQWPADGVAVCIWGGSDSDPMIVEDGSGGAIIAWTRNSGLTAQRVNSSGTLMWGLNPIPMTTTFPTVPQITSDGAGGAIVTWMELRTQQYDIYAQRILGSGVVPWTTSGIPVCTTAGFQKGYPVIVNNGLNGAFVAWNNSPPGGTYVQNLNDDGTVGPAASLINGCPTSNISITSNIIGASYQWQVNTGNGFVNISDNSNYTGAHAVTLQLNSLSSGWYGYIYRCVVNGSYSNSSKLKISNTWTGSATPDWESTGNWNCGTLPDANTDVIINSGTVVINTSTTVRTLTLAPNVNFTVLPGVTITIVHQ